MNLNVNMNNIHNKINTFLTPFARVCHTTLCVMSISYKLQLITCYGDSGCPRSRCLFTTPPQGILGFRQRTTLDFQA